MPQRINRIRQEIEKTETWKNNGTYSNRMVCTTAESSGVAAAKGANGVNRSATMASAQRVTHCIGSEIPHLMNEVKGR